MRIAVLASGSGTLLDAILDAGIDVEVVLTDRPCRAIEVARSHEVESVLVERTVFDDSFDRDGYTDDVVAALAPYDVELVVMAGYGTILGQPMHDAYPHRILNTHPALLPAFPGWHGVADALAYGVKVTGCTVHVATLEVDAGPILAQEAVPVNADDTESSLHERIKEVERRLYTDTIKNVISSPDLLDGQR